MTKIYIDWFGSKMVSLKTVNASESGGGKGRDIPGTTGMPEPKGARGRKGILRGSGIRGTREAAALFNERGASTLKTIIWILAIAGAIYAAYIVVPPWAAYYMLKTEVEDEARLAHMYKDETIKRRILTKANVWNVPIDSESVEIGRGGDYINIAIEYTVTFSFFDSYDKEQKFRIDVTKPLKETSGVLR